MFAPVFQISNKTLTSLINVEVARKTVDLVPLQKDWEERLRLESLARRVFAILRLKENSLEMEDMSKIARDEPERDDKAAEVALRTGVIGKEKEIQQVLNFLNANKLAEQIAYLTNKFKQTDYGESDLVKLNVLLGERLSPTTELGVYRQTDSQEKMGEMTPLAVEVPFQMEDLFGWFRNAGKDEIHPLLKVGVMLYELIRISPFTNNNLITAFSFVHLALSSEGYHFKKLWAPEEEMLKNKESYWSVMALVEREKGDLSLWLERFVRWADEAAEKTKTKLLNLVGETPIFKTDGGRVVSLTEREIIIMENLTIKNEMTIKEIRNLLPMVSDDTILRDLKDLMDKKMVKKKGKTKGAVYAMGKVKSYR